jgi:hypothetical protein
MDIFGFSRPSSGIKTYSIVMKSEAFLNDDELAHFYSVLRSRFDAIEIKPTKKRLSHIYDYIRFYKEDLLNSPEDSFDFIFNDKILLNRYGMHSLSALVQPLEYQGKLNKISLDIFSQNNGHKGKEMYFNIKLLEIEACVLKYKLDFMHSGTCY